MDYIAALLPALIMLPLAASVCCVLVANTRVCAAISIISAAALLVLSASALLAIDAHEAGILRYAFAGWSQPLGIELQVYGFTALMTALTSLLVFVLSIYSSVYFSSSDKALRFWPLWWLLIAGLNALFLSSDIFNIYVAFELIGLAAVALIAIENNRPALIAALRYLLVSLLGSLCYLLAVALLYREYGSLDLVQLASLATDSPSSSAALLLITIGLCLKTALFPMHFWLPAAHGSASAPVSAVLSALVVKGSFYLIARFWLDTLAPAASDSGLIILGIFGAGAILWGSTQALFASRLKVMVAYSTVAQIGYLFLLFPLMVGNSQINAFEGAAMGAITYLIVAHATAKSAMFLAAGNIMRIAGHDNIKQLKGLVRHCPLSIFTFAIAGASLIGLPPSAGFIAKWLLLSNSIAKGQWWWVIIILSGGLLAAAYVFKFLNLAFAKDDDTFKKADIVSTISPILPLCGLTLAFLTILLGFNAQWLLEISGTLVYETVGQGLKGVTQ
jgi:formate hydrogenlyase subunit 3/multisubunit Na+/H+ antiporter MnhD subunit